MRESNECTRLVPMMQSFVCVSLWLGMVCTHKSPEIKVWNLYAILCIVFHLLQCDCYVFAVRMYSVQVHVNLSTSSVCQRV